MKSMLQRGEQAFAWLLDYLYAGAWQLRALLPSKLAKQLPTSSDAQVEQIVLVPGIWESWQFMLPLARDLHQAGHRVHGSGPGLQPRYGTGDVEVVAQYLAKADLQEVVLVAHSKGGLIGKHLMAASTQGYRVNRMIAISTPFSGSSYARYAPIRSLRALSPNDTGVLKLAANLSVNARIISIFSRFDPHIPGGSELAGATNIKLETMGHFRLLNDQRLKQAVCEHLSSTGPA